MVLGPLDSLIHEYVRLSRNLGKDRADAPIIYIDHNILASMKPSLSTKRYPCVAAIQLGFIISAFFAKKLHIHLHTLYNLGDPMKIQQIDLSSMLIHQYLLILTLFLHIFQFV